MFVENNYIYHNVIPTIVENNTMLKSLIGDFQQYVIILYLRETNYLLHGFYLRKDGVIFLSHKLEFISFLNENKLK